MRAPPPRSDDPADSAPTMTGAPATDAVPTPAVSAESITALTVASAAPESLSPETQANTPRSATHERVPASPPIDSAPQTLVAGSPPRPDQIGAPEPETLARIDRDAPEQETLARIDRDVPEEETLARIDRASLDLPPETPLDDETLARATQPDSDVELATLARPSPVLVMGGKVQAPSARPASTPSALFVPPKLAPPRVGASALPPRPLQAKAPSPAGQAQPRPSPAQARPSPSPVPAKAGPSPVPPKGGPADSIASIRVLPAAEMSASSIGKYRLLAAIGEGGMADVFLAVSSGLGDFEKLVVIKQLRETLAEDPTFVQMFLDEARLAARLNHPNVVQTHEVVSDGVRHFIAMEYLEGVPYVRLARRKDRVTAPLALHLRILCDALYGLHYAHELKDFDGAPLNVVHRDVSPQNVMLTYAGGVKLLDFGIAKAAFAVDQRPDDFKGKLEYMAPEQARLEDVDRRADIFGIGVMLWEAVARRRMYVRGEDKYAKLVGGHLPDLREVRSDAPARLVKICAKALAHDPSARYASAHDMASELEEYLESTTQHVTNRDLGSYLSDKFARSREKMLSAIDAQLKALRTGEPPPPPHALSRLPDGSEVEGEAPMSAWSDAPPPVEGAAFPSAPPMNGAGFVPAPPLVPAFGSAPPPAYGSQPQGFDPMASGPSLYPPGVGTPSVAPAPSNARPVVFALVALAAAVLLFVGGVVALRARGPGGLLTRGASSASASASPSGASSVARATAGAPSSSSSPPAEVTSPSPPPVAVAAEIDYTVKVTPAAARIFVDGQEQTGNPASGRAPRDGKTHVIRVEADGFEPKQAEVKFDRSIWLSLELRQSSRTKTPRANPDPRPSPTPVATGTTRAPTPTRPPKRPKKKLDLDSDNPYGN